MSEDAKTIRLSNEELICPSTTFEQNADGTVSGEARMVVQLVGPDGQRWACDRLVRFRARRELKGLSANG